MIHTNAGRVGSRPQYHYVCTERRRHGSGVCRPVSFHETEETKGRAQGFVY